MALGTRWRRLSAGQQALLVVAYLRTGETYSDRAIGFGIGTTTVFRFIREAVGVLAALAPSLREAISIAARKAFVIVDGTLLSIDRVGMPQPMEVSPRLAGLSKSAARSGVKIGL